MSLKSSVNFPKNWHKEIVLDPRILARLKGASSSPFSISRNDYLSHLLKQFCAAHVGQLERIVLKLENVMTLFPNFQEGGGFVLQLPDGLQQQWEDRVAQLRAKIERLTGENDVKIFDALVRCHRDNREALVNFCVLQLSWYAHRYVSSFDAMGVVLANTEFQKLWDQMRDEATSSEKGSLEDILWALELLGATAGALDRYRVKPVFDPYSLLIPEQSLDVRIENILWRNTT